MLPQECRQTGSVLIGRDPGDHLPPGRCYRNRFTMQLAVSDLLRHAIEIVDADLLPPIGSE